MSREQADRFHAEAAAQGQEIFIEATIAGPHPSVAGQLAARLVPWGRPDREIEP